MDPKVVFDRPVEELLPDDDKSMQPPEDLYQLWIASAFVLIGVIGIWLHGKNVTRLMNLDKLLPPGLVTLHFHLALANLGVIAAFPFGATAAFYHRWIFGYTGCQVYAFEGMVCGMTTMALTLAICAVQWLDLQLNTKLQSWFYHLIAVLSWCFGIFWSVLPLVGFGKYALEPHQTTCTVEMLSGEMNSKAYVIALTVVGYVIPVGLTVLAYTVALRQYRHEAQEAEKGGSTSNKLEKLGTITKLNGWLLAHNITTWLPIGLITFWILLVGVPNIHPGLYYLPQLGAKLGCALTPLVYQITLTHLTKHRSQQSDQKSD